MAIFKWRKNKALRKNEIKKWQTTPLFKTQGGFITPGASAFTSSSVKCFVRVLRVCVAYV
jgi:hypothetical protein